MSPAVSHAQKLAVFLEELLDGAPVFVEVDPYDYRGFVLVSLGVVVGHVDHLGNAHPITGLHVLIDLATTAKLRRAS